MLRRELFFIPAGARAIAQTSARRPRVCAMCTVYTPNSHSDVFLTRLIGGYRLNRATHAPRADVVSMYVDQFPPADMARDMAEEYGFKIYPDIAQALRCGGSRMAVDGVAIIGEHGTYPLNDLGQKMYPRREFFEQAVRVMEQDRLIAPVYLDKHFSYSWENAKWIYDTARRLKIPLMAGSTVSLTWRYPPLELSRETELDEALVAGFGDTEAYGFHALEALQAIVERRKGGETGVASVQSLTGADVWKAASEGLWSRALLEEALTRTPTRVPGRPEELVKDPVLFLLEYRDGLKGRIFIGNGLLRSWVFAARRKPSNQVISTDCRIQFQLHNHWSIMVRNFEDLLVSGKLPNPVERTLLTTGVLAFAMESIHRNGARIDTPMLEIRYRA